MAIDDNGRLIAAPYDLQRSAPRSVGNSKRLEPSGGLRGPDLRVAFSFKELLQALEHFRANSRLAGTVLIGGGFPWEHAVEISGEELAGLTLAGLGVPLLVASYSTPAYFLKVTSRSVQLNNLRLFSSTIGKAVVVSGASGLVVDKVFTEIDLLSTDVGGANSNRCVLTNSEGSDVEGDFTRTRITGNSLRDVILSGSSSDVTVSANSLRNVDDSASAGGNSVTGNVGGGTITLHAGSVQAGNV